MLNDPELDGKYLGTITSDFVKVSKFLQEAAYQLKTRQISKFPIFIINKKKSEIGQLLLPKEKHQLLWNYSFSFLENLAQIGVIKEIEDFKVYYKDPEEFACLLVIDEENNFTRFVYIPYPEDDELL
ncbi:MAG: hypothetical protein EAZ31_08305 [Cytophagia bacterium]|nr:MAG: hypothetical protein EAY69_03475 [Cytophagales bacterium]TAG40531.1 MAG: hypothetical protein EAZ31_08305 [Cytophagia bacterium]TAH30297.1 MAG: hypothetical protein EAZ06_03525 [Cytophagales bacterium]